MSKQITNLLSRYLAPETSMKSPQEYKDCECASYGLTSRSPMYLVNIWWPPMPCHEHPPSPRAFRRERKRSTSMLKVSCFSCPPQISVWKKSPRNKRKIQCAGSQWITARKDGQTRISSLIRLSRIGAQEAKFPWYEESSSKALDLLSPQIWDWKFLRESTKNIKES